MGDDDTSAATREIADAYIEDHYGGDEAWLVIEVGSDTWPVKWDREYGGGLITDVLEYYGLSYDPDHTHIDVEDLIGGEIQVLEDERGNWFAVVTDVFGEIGE